MLAPLLSSMSIYVTTKQLTDRFSAIIYRPFVRTRTLHIGFCRTNKLPPQSTSQWILKLAYSIEYSWSFGGSVPRSLPFFRDPEKSKQICSIGKKLLAGQNLPRILSCSVYWKRPSWKSHNEAALITLLNDYPVAIPYYAHVLYMNYFFNAFTFDLVYLLPVVVLYELLLRSSFQHLADWHWLFLLPLSVLNMTHSQFWIVVNTWKWIIRIL